MYKTDHFQLNQWEKPDRVLMEDFNADNARLDAALQTLTERPTITKLNTFTVDRPITGAAVFDMDVSGIDWGAYAADSVPLSVYHCQRRRHFLRCPGDPASAAQS